VNIRKVRVDGSIFSFTVLKVCFLLKEDLQTSYQHLEVEVFLLT
jgi:hypothetical protein